MTAVINPVSDAVWGQGQGGTTMPVRLPPAGAANEPAKGSLSITQPTVRLADAGVVSIPTATLAVAAGLILTAALAQWWINENPQVIADAADQIGEKWNAAADAARRIGVEVAVPAKAAIEQKITDLFRGIKSGALSIGDAGRALVDSLSPQNQTTPSAPTARTAPQTAPQATPQRTAPVAPIARPETPPQTAAPDASAELQAQMRQIDRNFWVSTATLRIDTAATTLRSADEQIGPLNQSLSEFYWKASTGTPGRISGEVQAAVRAVQAVKDQLDQVVHLSNASVAGVQTAATTLERLGDARNAATARQRFDALSSRRDEIKQLASGLGTWLQQAYAYAQDGKQALPSLASIPSGRTIDIDRRTVTAARDAAQQALADGATALQAGNNAGSAAPPGGTVPPGGAAASGSPQPPGGPGPDDYTRRMVVGAGWGALAKAVAYAVNHRDKSIAELMSDPGIYIAALQGAGEGAALGFALTARSAELTSAQLREAVLNDFVFSGSATAVIDAGIRIAASVRDGAKVSDAINQYVRSGQVFDSLAAGVNTGVDAAALGIVPGTFIKIPALTGISERSAMVVGRDVASQTTRFFAPVPNYWRNMFGQAFLRSAVGSAVDLGNQVAASDGDTSKINGERVFWSGVGSSLYPFATQGLQRLTIPLARYPVVGRWVADRSLEWTTNPTTGARVTRTVIDSRVTDTKLPILAYGGRAVAYGVLISVLKRNAQEGRGLSQAVLEQSMRQTQEILGDEKKLEQHARDPAFQDTLRRMDNLSLIEKESLLGGYAPSGQASRQLAEMQSNGADLKTWLATQPQPQKPETEKERADLARVQRFHNELNQMIDGAYQQWRARSP